MYGKMFRESTEFFNSVDRSEAAHPLYGALRRRGSDSIKLEYNPIMAG